MPDWWLYISAAFFIVNLLLFLGLLYLVFFLIGFMKKMQPKIEALTTKIDGISKNVEELTEHVKKTSEVVGGRAQNIAGSVESIAGLAANTFERFAPYVTGALAAMRLFSGFMQMRKAMGPKEKLAIEVSAKGKKRKSAA